MNKMALNMVTELKVLPNQLSLWALLDAQIYLPPFQIKFPIISRNEKETSLILIKTSNRGISVIMRLAYYSKCNLV